jgi:formylglycine-generating enzyme
MRAFLKLSVLISVLLFIFGCSDNSTGESPNPIILSVEPMNASPGDIITIYGTNLGFQPSNGEVRVSGSIIPASKIIKWNNSFVRLNLPLNAMSGNITVSYNNKSSNEFNYAVADKPSIDMVAIQAGEFLMGSENGFGDERPAHKVKITKAFEIGKFEVTQKIWRLVINYNNSRIVSDQLPVLNVSWNEAIEFCNKLSNILGFDTAYIISGSEVILNPISNGYRLPTEAEWEYACGAGTNSDYPVGSDINSIAWYNGNSAYNPHPVGLKAPNQWNLYDMNGNAWEWCWDWYEPEYYFEAPGSDPKGPVTGSRHVLRGGSCADGATYARSANRSYQSANFINCGFRLARNR